MIATVTNVTNWRNGIPAIVIRLAPESVPETHICLAIQTGVPPEGNIVGWTGNIKIVVETGE